jgi:hypothetical protein
MISNGKDVNLVTLVINQVIVDAESLDRIGGGHPELECER